MVKRIIKKSLRAMVKKRRASIWLFRAVALTALLPGAFWIDCWKKREFI